ncbi:hypothetical protein Hanom_Chr12g01146971 [Helianthus anomalus]
MLIVKCIAIFKMFDQVSKNITARMVVYMKACMCFECMHFQEIEHLQVVLVVANSLNGLDILMGLASLASHPNINKVW